VWYYVPAPEEYGESVLELLDHAEAHYVQPTWCQLYNNRKYVRIPKNKKDESWLRLRELILVDTMGLINAMPSKERVETINSWRVSAITQSHPKDKDKTTTYYASVIKYSVE